MSVKSVSGNHVSLATGMSSKLHTSITLHLYMEIAELEKEYVIDMLSVQSLGTPKDHAAIVIVRIIEMHQSSEPAADGEGLAVVASVILVEDQLTALVAEGWPDVSEAIDRATERAGGPVGKAVTALRGKTSTDIAAQAMVQDLLASIQGEPDEEEKEA